MFSSTPCPNPSLSLRLLVSYISAYVFISFTDLCLEETPSKRKSRFNRSCLTQENPYYALETQQQVAHATDRFQLRAIANADKDYSNFDLSENDVFQFSHDIPSKFSLLLVLFVLLIYAFIVPVFDARETPFSFKEHHRLGRLPLFQEEISTSSIVVVGHTIFHQVQYNKFDNSAVGFGLQWVIVLATPLR